MSSVENRPVLVGVSPFADHVRVLRWAADEAARRGVGLRLAHAYPLLPAARIWPAGEPVLLADEDGPRRQARRVVALAARRVGVEHPDLPIDTVVAEGSVEEVLRRESEGAGLVVVGGDSRGPLAEAVLDSVAGTLLHDVACPVVALPPVAGAAEATGPVVVAVDEGGTSAGAVAFGFHAAFRAGVELHAVHCWQAPRAPRARIRERDTRLRMLRNALAGLRGQFPEVDLVEMLRDGHPLDELTSASHRAGILVVGTRGRGPVTSAVLGSTSRALARCAGCPVAVVHVGYPERAPAGSALAAPGPSAGPRSVPGGHGPRHRARA